MLHTLLNQRITILRWSWDAPRTGVGERKFTSHQLFNNLAFGAVKVKVLRPLLLVLTGRSVFDETARGQYAENDRTAGAAE
jgi:hypothetical protein